MSLRGLLLGIAGLLLALTLMSAVALVAITTRMARNSERLWQAVESVRVAEELEIALLLHSGRPSRHGPHRGGPPGAAS